MEEHTMKKHNCSNRYIRVPAWATSFCPAKTSLLYGTSGIRAAPEKILSLSTYSVQTKPRKLIFCRSITHCTVLITNLPLFWKTYGWSRYSIWHTEHGTSVYRVQLRVFAGAKTSLLLRTSGILAAPEMPFEKRWCRYKELGKKVPQAYFNTLRTLFCRTTQ